MNRDKTDGLGLDKLEGFDLAAMLDPVSERFREIDVGSIREDGDNPRTGFDPATLEELALTIRSRGVITPISVRTDPEREGRYIVNHGHRRLRAAKMAGLSAIPAVVDETFRDEDRIIENIQRDNLNMFDVAAFIARKLAEGVKQKEIAALIGKSTAYVSNHAQLLELPPLTRDAVGKGLVGDVTTINDLVKIEKKHPESAAMFLAGDNEVTRTAVRAFRSRLDADASGKTEPPSDKNASGKVEVGTKARAAAGLAQETGSTADKVEWGVNTAGKRTASSDDWRHGVVIVEMDGKRGMLRLDKRPKDENHVWVEWEDGVKDSSQAAVSRLVIRAVTGG